MYCRNCGEKLENDAVFCGVCGKPVYENSAQGTSPRARRTASSPAIPPQREGFANDRNSSGDGYQRSSSARRRNGKFASKRRSPVVPILWGVTIVAICLVALLGGSMLLEYFSKPTVEENIAIVQNGYLGDFTDVTINALFHYTYGDAYETEKWDGGETDSGKDLVEVRFFDTGKESDGVAVQFTMLSDECFKITAYVAPEFPIHIQSVEDLNAILLMQYAAYHADDDNDLFWDGLEEIPASIVQYGAADSYDGDRKEIFRMDGKTASFQSAQSLLVEYVDYLDDLGVMDEEEPVSEPDVQPTPTIAEVPAETVASRQESKAIKALRDATSGEQHFFLTNTEEYVDVYGIKDLGGDYFPLDAPMTPTQFAVVDLDWDGIPEIIVELDSEMGGWRMILRYYENEVYGYLYGFRALSTISEDGLVGGSSSASSSSVSRITFEETNVHSYDLSAEDAMAARDSWQEVAWYTFTPQNVSTVVY